VVANPSDDAPRCDSCGCYLAADDPSPVCSPCRGAYHHARRDGYRPQHDPELRARVLETLRAHRGERINIYRVMGMWPCGLEEWVTVKNHILYLRAERSKHRVGHTIDGYHDGTYRYVSGPNDI
jgi:hypothetical protein